MTKPWPFPSQTVEVTTTSEQLCSANTPAIEQDVSKLESPATTTDLFPAPLLAMMMQRHKAAGLQPSSLDGEKTASESVKNT